MALALFLWGLGPAAVATSDGAALKTTYILVVDSSGSMKDSKNYFDPARQQTRWEFMLDSIERFLDSLEDGTVVNLILFGKTVMPVIEYPLGAVGVSAASIRRDIANYPRLEMFKSQGSKFIHDFYQKTALYNTLGVVMEQVRIIAGTRKDRPIEILFFADGVEDLPRALYRDPRLKAAPDNRARARIVSADFERLVLQDGYRNTWLYFTWLVNKEQFTSEAYRKALKAGPEALPVGLADNFAKLLRERPLINRSGNHIIYDLPYPKLPVAILPRQQMLANPQRRNRQAITLDLEFSDRAAAHLEGQTLGLRLPEELRGAASLVRDKAPFARGQASFPLEVFDPELIDTQRSYRFALVFPRPQALGGSQVQAPREVEVSFAPLTPPRLEVLSPRDGATYFKGDTVLLQVAPLHAEVEWTVDSKRVLKGRVVELPLERAVRGLPISVRAIDPDVPANVSQRNLRINVADLDLRFDGFPTGKVVNAGEPFSVSVLGSPEITNYQWSVNRNTRMTEGKARPRADGRPGSELTLSLDEPRDYLLRVSGLTAAGAKRIEARPNPLALSVRPKPALRIIDPDSDIAQQFALSGVTDSGALLRAEVFGEGYDQVEWLLEAIPAGSGTLAQPAPSAVETGEGGARIARKRLGITEDSGVRQVRITARTRPVAADRPVLISRPITLRLIPPRRDVIVFQPPVSAAIRYSGTDTEFIAEVLGPSPRAVRWTLNGPGGKVLRTADEAVVNEPGGRRLSRFRFPFADPEYAQPKGEDFRLRVAGIYASDRSEAGSQGSLTYRVRHAPRAYRVELGGPAEGVRWNARLKAGLQTEQGEPEPGRIRKVQWVFLDKSGRKKSWETTELETVLALAELDPDHPYAPKRLLARVFDRVQGVVETAPRGIFVKPVAPVFDLRLDGQSEAARTLSYGDSITISDRSSGDIVARRWLLTDRAQDGTVLATREVANLKDLPFQRDGARGDPVTETEISLRLTDPAGQDFSAPAAIVIRNVPPRPWEWLVAAVGVLLVMFATALYLFTGNVPRSWGYLGRERLRDMPEAEIGEEDELLPSRPEPVAPYWNRWHKRATIPVNRVIGDGLIDQFGADACYVLAGKRMGADSWQAAITLSCRNQPIAGGPVLESWGKGQQDIFTQVDPDNRAHDYEIQIWRHGEHSRSDVIGLAVASAALIAGIAAALYGVLT